MPLARYHVSDHLQAMSCGDGEGYLMDRVRESPQTWKGCNSDPKSPRGGESRKGDIIEMRLPTEKKGDFRVSQEQRKEEESGLSEVFRSKSICRISSICDFPLLSPSFITKNNKMACADPQDRKVQICMVYLVMKYQLEWLKRFIL